MASLQLGQEYPVVQSNHVTLPQVPADGKLAENEPSPQSCTEISPCHSFKGQADKPGHSNKHNGSLSINFVSSACVNSTGCYTQLSKHDAAQSSLSNHTSKGHVDLHTESDVIAVQDPRPQQDSRANVFPTKNFTQVAVNTTCTIPGIKYLQPCLSP